MWAQDHIPTTRRGKICASWTRDSRDFAITNGLVMRSKTNTNDNCVIHVPFTLFPSPYPKGLYDMCISIQPIINKLMLKIANDTNYLESSLKTVSSVDDFTRNLLGIHQSVMREGLAQPIISCISRSDYMLDNPSNDAQDFRMRQVEVNAIASALSSHSCGITAMHDYLRSKYSWHDEKLAGFAEFPANNSLKLVVDSLIKAHDAYGNPNAVILLIMEQRSFNFSEHLKIELEVVKARPSIRVSRQRFCDLPKLIKLGPNKELLMETGDEVALVYFRFGYDPSNYDFTDAWQTRLTLERSRAIKCPSIGFHLSGVKKFQQLLHNQEQLERFLEPAEARQLVQVLSKFWSLESGTEDGEAGFKLGLQQHDRLVLKPQREGGGHNIYGTEIRQLLENIAESPERRQYILMELIKSPREKNILLHSADEMRLDCLKLQDGACDALISELGIYGNMLASGEVQLDNSTAGYLVRSKRAGVNEGGVVSGFAGLSSVILINEQRADLSKFYHDLG